MTFGQVLISLFIWTSLFADVPYKNIAEFNLDGETIFIEFEEYYGLEMREDYCFYDSDDIYKGEAEKMIKERVVGRFSRYKERIRAYKELLIVPMNTTKSPNSLLYATRTERRVNRQEFDALEIVRVFKGNFYGYSKYDSRFSRTVLENL